MLYAIARCRRRAVTSTPPPPKTIPAAATASSDAEEACELPRYASTTRQLTRTPTARASLVAVADLRLPTVRPGGVTASFSFLESPWLFGRHPGMRIRSSPPTRDGAPALA